MVSHLRITFILPTYAPTGGAQVVYRHARAALDRGHDVRLVAERIPLSTPFTARGRRAIRRWVASVAHDRLHSTLARYGVSQRAREVGRVVARAVPAGDVVVATSFETAEWVAELPASAGVPVYFLQGYEAWTPDLEPRVDATWRLPFIRLAISEWLVSLGR